MERRKTTFSKSSALPKDYLAMVTDVFKAHFDAGLKIFCEHKPNTQFEVTGEIYADEIVLRVALITEGALAATTVHASSDYDAKASAPTIQELLEASVDGIAMVYSDLLDPEKPLGIEQLAADSLAAVDNIPILWTTLDVNKRNIFIKVDKANPKLDTLADAWLAAHDPKWQEHEAEEHKATEALFVTGPKKKGEHTH